jgi:hypothetical protein
MVHGAWAGGAIATIVELPAAAEVGGAGVGSAPGIVAHPIAAFASTLKKSDILRMRCFVVLDDAGRCPAMLFPCLDSPSGQHQESAARLIDEHPEIIFGFREFEEFQKRPHHFQGLKSPPTERSL